MNSNFEKIIKSYLLPKDDYFYGLADMGNLFNTVFGIHRYAIVIGRKLNTRLMLPCKKCIILAFGSRFFNHPEDFISFQITLSLLSYQ